MTTKPLIFLFFSLLLAAPARAEQGLAPQSLQQLYSMASSGNVYGLRYAAGRGMNIDTPDNRGNTAMCRAILDGNYTAYNTLRAAGANPKARCVAAMDWRTYASFMNSNQALQADEIAVEDTVFLSDGESLWEDYKWPIVFTAGVVAAIYFINPFHIVKK